MIPHKKDITFYKLRLSLLRVLCGTMHIPKLSIPFSYLANLSQKEDQFAWPCSQGIKVWWIRLKNLWFMTNVFAKYKLKIAWFHRER